MAHLAKPFQGADQAAQDYSRTAVDAATFGQGDRLQAYLTGNPLEQERAKTAAASGRLGAMAPIVQGAMYAMGPGELGIAKGLGEAAAPMIGKWAGGVLGSGIEGAGAGMIGAAGHDEDPNQGMLVGGGLGALGGVPGGVVGRGGALAPALSEDALRARASQEYAPLDAMVFHGPSQVKPALDAVTNTMTKSEQDLAASTMAKVNKLADTNLTTGSDIQKYQKLFGGLAKTGGDVDRQYAPQFKSALESVMQADPYGRNLTPGQGMSLMPAGTLGGTGFAPGAAAAARDAGDVFHGRANDIERLNDMVTKSQVTGGPDVGSQARQYLLSKPGQVYAQPGSTPYGAFDAIAGTSEKGGYIPWWMKHYVIAPAIGAAGGGALGAVTGDPHSPWTHALEDAAIGAGIGMAGGTYGGASGAVNKAAQQRAIAAARSAISTGQAQAPVMPLTPLREAVRQAIYGRGAANGWPY
jgi:hypothetical protein